MLRRLWRNRHASCSLDRRMRPLRHGARGFTLVEMMLVVTLVGVLAALAVYGVRKYIYSSKTGEALDMIRAIKTAQETYRSETFTYLNVSTSFDAALSNFYPTSSPGRSVTAWGGGDETLSSRWKTLGVWPSAPVNYTYATVAGAAGTAPAAPLFTVGNWPSAATGQPWYVVMAAGDLDGNGEHEYFASASFTGEIHSNQP